ncbi:MAG: DNA polymerase III subunit alpha [Actinomycetota bacterium]
MKEFAHLHVHTEYSLLDGASRISELVNAARDAGSPAIALTDHGVMYGAIEFYRAAKQAGVKPIIGCEVYVTKNRLEKSTGYKEGLNHLILLAKNNQGYRNLMHIVSRSYTEGYYYRPRTDKDLLRTYKEGLVALSSCLKGEIAKAVTDGQTATLKELAAEYQDIFGEGNFFLEVQDHGLPEQKKVNEALVTLAKETGIALVATNDCHYVKKEDAAAQDVLLCIGTGVSIDDPGRLKLPNDEFYLKTPQQMAKLFADIPEAVANSLKIADMCHVEIDFDTDLLPHYEVPDGYDLNSYLEKLCRDGLVERYPVVTPELEARLKMELSVIMEKGFPGYFLIVWDFVHYAKSQGIRVGPGRGSAAGSLVSYLLKITDIDPIKYNLVFERFLNPERVSLPDVDIDFDDSRREEVIDYVTEKYGADHVAQIITFGTLKAKMAVRDAARVLNMPYAQADRLAKLIPDGIDVSIEDAFRASPELRDEYERDESARAVLDTAKAIGGLHRNAGIHAAGVVISPEPLPNYAPLQLMSNGEIVIQYDMDSANKIGLLKMDFLGLRNLTVIDNALKIIKRTRGVEVDIDNPPLDDKKTYALLRKGDGIGVFQLESSGMRSLLREMKPERLEDIIALIALFRPGPLGAGVVKDFVARKQGKQAIEYPHPSLEPILKDTYGIMVYQEQVMRIANVMAGYSLGQAEKLIKSISKKVKDVMAEQKEKFIGGALAKGYDKQVAASVFEKIEFFVGYGFNLSHATCYAYIANQTAYLKANYTSEYMAALLTSVTGNKDKVVMYVNECRRLKIPVLPPDINESYKDFTVVGDSIRFGLSVVRNVGHNVVEAIIKARTESKFKSLEDFCARVDMKAVNKRAVESLIKSGAFDFAGTRRALLANYEAAMDSGAKTQRDRAIGQGSLFGEDTTEGSKAGDKSNGEDIVELNKDVKLGYEKEMLGVYVSDHPLNGLEKQMKNQADATLSQLREMREGEIKWVGGIVAELQKKMTKKGDVMAIMTLEDLESTAEVVVFPNTLEKAGDLIKKDGIVLVRAKIDQNEGRGRFGDEAEGRLKLAAMEIKPLDRREDAERPVTIYLDIGRFSDQLLERLKEILTSHPGVCPVVLKVKGKTSETVLELGQGYKITRANGLFAEIKELLGDKAIQG